ncbi:MAG: DUF1294 domain-containing protein [Firmicutes bacterium]|nr:DUF1294 domain-containing protein [Bacillota bacterium]
MLNKIIIILIVWNLLVFALYGIDKQKSRHGGSRISERLLLLATLLMGAIGALLGMLVFRHKTKHAKFQIGVPIILIINIAIGFFAVQGMGAVNNPVEYQKITPEKAKTLMNDKDAIVVDVRTEMEFAEAHIEGAILIPDTVIREKAPQLLTDKNSIILVYCRSGNRSEKAARALIDLGYTRVYDFGGIINWPYDIVN